MKANSVVKVYEFNALLAFPFGFYDFTGYTGINVAAGKFCWRFTFGVNFGKVTSEVSLDNPCVTPSFKSGSRGVSGFRFNDGPLVSVPILFPLRSLSLFNRLLIGPSSAAWTAYASADSGSSVKKKASLALLASVIRPPSRLLN